MKRVRGSKKGFTLIEVILAIVVVAVIMGIAIPKVMSNSDKAQIKQVISSDIRSIIVAAADWKRTDRTNASGSYANIAGDMLNSRLPSNMSITNTIDIKSSGFGGGCIYSVDGNGSSAFNMGMDCSSAATNLSWNTKLIAYAREAFIDTVKSLSTNANSLTSGTVANVTCNDNESYCANGITQ